jgi:hypothetical protein
MTDIVVRNADYARVVRSSFAQQGLMRLYGAQLTRVEPGAVEIEGPFRSDLTQQQGFFHGGVTTAIVDTACGYSALTLMPEGCEWRDPLRDDDRDHDADRPVAAVPAAGRRAELPCAAASQA